MKLDKYFSIECDGNCTTLKYEKITPYADENGVIKTKKSKDETYYPNIHLALKAYANKCIERNIDSNTEVVDLIAKFDEINSIINNFKV